MPGLVDRHHVAAVVAPRRMIEKRDEVPLRRDPHVRHPARGPVDDLPDRVFELLRSSDFADDGELLAIGRPVRPLDVVQDLARRTAAGHRQARESAHPQERIDRVPPHRERHLSRAGDGQDLRPDQTEGTRLGALRAADEDLHRPSVPGRRVQDRLAVRREPRRSDLPAPERQLLEDRRLAEPEPLAGEEPGDAGRERIAGRDELVRSHRFRRRGGLGRVLSRDVAAAGVSERWSRTAARSRARSFVVPNRSSGSFDRHRSIEPAHRRRDPRVELRHGLGLFPDDRRQRLRRRAPLERALARRHLVQDRAERELVRSEVERPAARLLGRHVADGAHHHAGARRRRPPPSAGPTPRRTRA